MINMEEFEMFDNNNENTNLTQEEIEMFEDIKTINNQEEINVDQNNTEETVMIKNENGEIVEYNLRFMQEIFLPESSSADILWAFKRAYSMLMDLETNEEYRWYLSRLFVEGSSYLHEYECYLSERIEGGDQTAVVQFELLKFVNTVWDFFPEDEFFPSMRSSRLMVMTKKNFVIHEMVLDETETGHVVRFNSVYAGIGTNAFFKKTWDWKLLINNSGLHKEAKMDKPVRMLWKNSKTGKVMFGQSIFGMASMKMIPMLDMGTIWVEKVIQDIVSLEDILPIGRYYPKAYEGGYGHGIHPYNVSQGDIYWIGTETSVKKILNKAFRHPHGVTKKAFGGINTIQDSGDLGTLKAAILICRALRGFDPSVLEECYASPGYYSWANGVLKQFKMTPDGIRYFFEKFGWNKKWVNEIFGCASNFPEDYFKYELNTVLDTIRMFKQIKSVNLRAAIIAHVRRNDMSIHDVHDFVSGELRKMRQANFKLAKTTVSRIFSQYDGKEISSGITLVMPKMSHDLVNWGATQNNCIGSYVMEVNAGDCSIFGFKGTDGEWIGHAQVNQGKKLMQLLGKHNQRLDDEKKLEIEKFFKTIEVDCTDYWGKN